MGISLLGLSLSSCVSEEPFGAENGAETLVKFSVDLNSTVTRAVSDNEISSLLDNCILYISNSQGLLHKWQGLQNIPTSGVYLKYGQYVAEAWAGDSVPASFDSRFFEGYTNFSISNNEIPTQVTVNCKIRNVVVSVDASQLPEFSLDNLKVHVESSNGKLDFAGEDLSRKGYFMRSYDKDTKKYDSELKYTVSGLDVNGNLFTKEGVISNVQSAHEYVITLESGEKEEEEFGGIPLSISIKEYELEIKEDILIHSEPKFQWENEGVELSDQLKPNEDGKFEDYTLNIAAYQGFKSLKLSVAKDNEVGSLKSALGGYSELDLLVATGTTIDDLKEKGLTFSTSVDSQNTPIYNITFRQSWFDKLDIFKSQYVITIKAEDERGLTSSTRIRIANDAMAVDAPFSIDEELWRSDYLSVRAHSATIKLDIKETADDINNIQLQYRKKTQTDSEEWKNFGSAFSITEGTQEVKLQNLATGTEYEVKAIAGDWIEDISRYRYETDPVSFTTESYYPIPNGSLESWSQTSKYWEPFAKDSVNSCWDTGNEGSTLLGTENVTMQESDIKHNGLYSAKLQTKLIQNLKMAAGNLFIGEFKKASMIPMGAQLTFGKPFNGSHPTALKVWMKYDPVTVDERDSSCPDNSFQKGNMDNGQIYVAIASSPSEIDTSNKDYFKPEASNILAYGETTFTSSVGGGSELVEVTIPIHYDGIYEGRANKFAATNLIIVCSSSKYGDYYTGGVGSIMYLDDFQLVYDE